MKWPDLEKHERFGAAIADMQGFITNCNGAFAGHLGTDVTGASGTRLHDWISEECGTRLDERLGDLRDSRVACASFNVTMSHSSSVHAIEIVCFGNLSSESLWVVSFAVPAEETSEVQKKLEALNERVLSFFMNGGPSNEINFNTTNITGDKNQSVQAENVKDAKQDN